MAATPMPYTNGSDHSTGLVCLTKAPKPEKHIEAKAIDIVAVHGLSAEPGNNIWQAADGTFWLRDLIPKDIKGARVFAFNYDAQALFSGQQHSLDGVAQTLLSEITAARHDVSPTRPLIFICHGFGGLLVESALNQTLMNPSPYPTIEAAVKVVVFLSCPQRPSEILWPDILMKCAVDAVNTGRPVSEGTYRGVLDWLNQHAQCLEGVPKDFKKNVSRMKIKVCSCYEQAPTPSQPQCSLDEYTGALGTKIEKVQMMGGCDHHSLATFSSKDDENYKFIISAIKKVRKAASQAPEPAPAAAPEAALAMLDAQPASLGRTKPAYQRSLPLPQTVPPLVMPTPLFPASISTHFDGQPAPQGPISIFTQSSSRNSVSPVTPISPTHSIDPSKMKIARRPVGLPPSNRSSPAGTPVAPSIRSLSSASNQSGHASASPLPLQRPGPLRSVSQPAVIPPTSMTGLTSTRSLSDTSTIPPQLQPMSHKLAQHPSHQSLSGQIAQDSSQNIMPLRRQSRVKSIKSIDGLPEGVAVHARRQSLETRALPDVQRGGQLSQSHAHAPFSGATQRSPGLISKSPVLAQQNTTVPHTRSVSQPMAQYPAVPHPPPTARFMHSSHPPHQVSGLPPRQPPMPQRPGHVAVPLALTPGPVRQLPHPGPMQIAHPQSPAQVAPAKMKKAKKTPKVSKKEQRRIALQQQQPHPQGVQGVPLQPVQPKVSKKEQRQLPKQTGAHPPIQSHHLPNAGPPQRPGKPGSAIKMPAAQKPPVAPKPAKQPQARPPPPQAQSARPHGPSLDRTLDPKPAKKPSLFSRMFGGSSHHSAPSPRPNSHAHASGALVRPLPSSFSGPTGPHLAGQQAAPMPNKPQNTVGGGKPPKPQKPQGGSGHGLGHGWGHQSSGHGAGHGPSHEHSHALHHPHGPGHGTHGPHPLGHAHGHDHGHSPSHGHGPPHNHTHSQVGNHPGSHHGSPSSSKTSLHSHTTSSSHNPNGAGNEPNDHGPAQATSNENPPSSSTVSPPQPGTEPSTTNGNMGGETDQTVPGDQTITTYTSVNGNANISAQQWPGYNPEGHPPSQGPTLPGLSDPQHPGVSGQTSQPQPYPYDPYGSGYDPGRPGYSDPAPAQPWNNTGTYDPSRPGDYNPPYNPGFTGTDTQIQTQTGAYPYNSETPGELDRPSPWQAQQPSYGTSLGPYPGQPGVYNPAAPGGTDRFHSGQDPAGGSYRINNAIPAGYAPYGQQPPGTYQANSAKPSGVGKGGLIAAGVGGAALGGLAAAGIMHGVGGGSDEDEGESDDSEDEDGDDTDEDNEDEDENGSDDDSQDEDDEDDEDGDADGDEEGDTDDSDEDEDSDSSDDEEEDEDDDDEDEDEEDDDDDDDDDEGGAYSYDEDDY